MKPISLEELSKERVKNRITSGCRCPIKNCYDLGNFTRCHLDTYVLCPIFDSLYSRLNFDQRNVLLDGKN